MGKHKAEETHAFRALSTLRLSCSTSSAVSRKLALSATRTGRSILATLFYLSNLRVCLIPSNDYVPAMAAFGFCYAASASASSHRICIVDKTSLRTSQLFEGHQRGKTSKRQTVSTRRRLRDDDLVCGTCRPAFSHVIGGSTRQEYLTRVVTGKDKHDVVLELNSQPNLHKLFSFRSPTQLKSCLSEVLTEFATAVRHHEPLLVGSRRGNFCLPLSCICLASAESPETPDIHRAQVHEGAFTGKRIRL